MRDHAHFMCANSNKVPLNASTGYFGSKDDPSQWLSFGDAQYFAGENDWLIGFVPRPDDPFVIIDLDFKPGVEFTSEDASARNNLLMWAMDNTYVEKSISGNGYHVVITGALPNDINSGTKRGVEAYANKGFVVLTGNVVSKTTEVINSGQTCEWLTKTYATAENAKIQADTDIDWFRAPTDAEKIEDQKALDWFSTFSNSAEIQRWFNAKDFADPSYKRRSEDDAALMQLFYKFNKGKPDRDFATIRMFIRTPRAAYLSRKSNKVHYLLNETLPKVKAWIDKEENRVANFESMASQAFDKFSAMQEAQAREQAQALIAKASGVPNSNIAPGVEAPVEQNPFKFFTASELKQRDPIKWAIRNVFPTHGLGAIYGESGSGKSFLALDMMVALATGSKWFGIKTTQLPVICLALEGAGGLRQRVLAWEAAHPGESFPESILFFDGNFVLTDTEKLGAFCAALNNGHGTFDGVVIIDTLNQASGGADENSSRDMGELLAGMKFVQQKTNSLVVAVHHATKSKENQSMRGHGSFQAACDGVLEVRKEVWVGEGKETQLLPGTRQWSTIKVKDGRDDTKRLFKLVEHDLGFDDGEPLSSVAVEPVQDSVDPVTGEIQQAVHNVVSGVNSRKAPGKSNKSTYSDAEYAQKGGAKSTAENNQNIANNYDFGQLIQTALSMDTQQTHGTNKGKFGVPPEKNATPRNALVNLVWQIANPPEMTRELKKGLMNALDYQFKSGKIGRVMTDGTQYFWLV